MAESVPGRAPEPGKSPMAESVPGAKLDGVAKAPGSAAGGKPLGKGEMSSAQVDANFKEMKQLERSGNAYDAKGSPTPAYGEVLRKIEAHVDARAASGRAPEPGRSPMAESVRAPTNAPDAAPAQQAPGVTPETGPSTLRGIGPDGPSASPGTTSGTGEMSGAQGDEMRDPSAFEASVGRPGDVQPGQARGRDDVLGPNGRDRPPLGQGGGVGDKSADPRQLSNADLASVAREMSEYIRGLDETSRRVAISEGFANKIDGEIGRRYTSDKLELGKPPAGDKPGAGEGLVPR